MFCLLQSAVRIIKQVSVFVNKRSFCTGGFLQTWWYLGRNSSSHFTFMFRNCANFRFNSVRFLANEMLAYRQISTDQEFPIFLPTISIFYFFSLSFPGILGVVAGKYYFLLLTLNLVKKKIASPYNRSISTLQLKWIPLWSNTTNSARK